MMNMTKKMVWTLAAVALVAVSFVAAAFVITGGSWTNTVNAGYGTVTVKTSSVPVNPAINTEYGFTLTVSPSADTSNGKVIIDISKPSIDPANVVLKYGGSALIADTSTAGHLIYTVDAGSAWTSGSTYDFAFTLEYAAAGAYDVAYSASG